MVYALSNISTKYKIIEIFQQFKNAESQNLAYFAEFSSIFNEVDIAGVFLGFMQFLINRFLLLSNIPIKLKLLEYSSNVGMLGANVNFIL